MQGNDLFGIEVIALTRVFDISDDGVVADVGLFQLEDLCDGGIGSLRGRSQGQ